MTTDPQKDAARLVAATFLGGGRKRTRNKPHRCIDCNKVTKHVRCDDCTRKRLA